MSISEAKRIKKEIIHQGKKMENEYLELDLGFKLINLADTTQGGNLLEQIRTLKKEIASEFAYRISPKKVSIFISTRHKHVKNLTIMNQRRKLMKNKKCSFCGASESQDNPVIVGQDALICKHCVMAAYKMMAGDTEAKVRFDIKSAKSFLEEKLYIPPSQNSSKWTEQQVINLINGIWEFSSIQYDE